MQRISLSLFWALVVLSLICWPRGSFSQVPTTQDCLGAIPVCQESYTQTNVYSGYGSFLEIPSVGSCPNNCMDGEKNSVWYIITVQSSGMMSFEIDPIVQSDDYDWGVYNITEAECGDIYGDPSLQVACNAAGGAGYQGNTGAWSAMGGNSACEGGGNTNKWCLDVPVSEGETYVVCVSNWTQSNEGYTIDFSPSTANIYDNVKPYISWVQESFGCVGETEVFFEFSEFVLCETVDPSDFILLDPNGNALTILDVIGEACEDGGSQEVSFKLVLDPATPVIESGMHSLVINGPISDLCSNYAGFEGFDFMVVTDAPYVNFDGLPANLCITDDPKELVSNRDQGVFSIDPDCGDCLQDHGDGTATLFPTLMDEGWHGVSFYYDDGVCDNDTTQFVVANSVPGIFDLSEGGTFCEGEEGIEIILYGTENMVLYDLKRDGVYLESRIGDGGPLSFNYWDVPGTYTVEASSFCGVSVMNGSCVIEVLATPAIFDVTLTQVYCENLSGGEISLTDSEPGVTYELLLEGNSLSPPVTVLGVGGQLPFPRQSVEGVYTVYAGSGDCGKLMNGAVTLSKEPVPVVDFVYEGVCQGDPTVFTNQSTISSGAIASYLWTFNDNGATSSEENPTHTFSNFGSYEVELVACSALGCMEVEKKQVHIVEQIEADAGEDQVIPYGTSTTLSGEATGGDALTFHWEPEEFVTDPTAMVTTTTNLYEECTFVFRADDSGSECYAESSVDISLEGGPLRADPEATAEYVCEGEGITLFARPAGGAGTYTYQWSSDPSGFSSVIENPSIASLSVPTTFTVVVYDGFNEVTESVFVDVKANVSVEAGEDQNIPYQYATQLACEPHGESLTYQWSPEASIDGSSTIYNPMTTALTENTVFHVEVTNVWGCSGEDNVQVSVTGGPLTTSAYASDSSLCQHDTIFLFASASGGGQPWSYQWTVTPGAWTSTEENPVFYADQVGDFTFHLQLSDQQNTVEAEVNVVVNPSPVVDLMAASFDSIVDPAAHIVAVCVSDSVLLNAANPGFSYIWSTGETDSAIVVGTTGIGGSTQRYYVEVLNNATGCVASDTIYVVYSFAMCSYGVNDLEDNFSEVKIYPNPVRDKLTISVKGVQEETVVYMTDLQGKTTYYRASIPGKTAEWKHNVDLSVLPPGTYLLVFSSKEGLRMEKLIKGHP
ncbi:MAG: hypothetical protein CSA95_05140 [Bacteroidetes bacterium]|nr:MAG: hypothetical protein CSA95_05140 [Bacteroidota bacterium]